VHRPDILLGHMRQSHIIFNVVGLTMAFIFAVSGCGQLMGHGRESTLLWTGLVVLLVGGGSIANLGNRGLSTWPTITMIAGYCISVFLIPFGIWGIVALALERKRRYRRRR
jgi:hypothetical protein